MWTWENSHFMMWRLAIMYVKWKTSVGYRVRREGTKNMASIIFINIMPKGGWTCFVNISMRCELILSKGVVALLIFILLQITTLSKSRVGLFWGEQDRSYKSSNFTFPRELRGLLSSLLSKLSLKKMASGKGVPGAADMMPSPTPVSLQRQSP